VGVVGALARQVSTSEAENMIKYMISLGTSPELSCYNAIFKAYASKAGDDVAAEAAMAMFRDMTVVPNCATFQYVLETCRHKEVLVNELFDVCTRAGQLDESLANEFRAVGTSFIKSQLGDPGRSLNPDWSKNATRVSGAASHDLDDGFGAEGVGYSINDRSPQNKRSGND
jgi:hypothetical protein